MGMTDYDADRVRYTYSALEVQHALCKVKRNSGVVLLYPCRALYRKVLEFFQEQLEMKMNPILFLRN
jgi:hypothetical protein